MKIEKKRSDGWYKLKVGLRVQITNHYGGLFKKKGKIISLTKKKAVVELENTGGRILKMKSNLKRIRPRSADLHFYDDSIRYCTKHKVIDTERCCIGIL